ncbi:MAG: biotin carboxyl carrier protein [Syntrophus sp. (in: bacteria)]|nr:biotin carboxyl carrier protein [Syntrophus sp. (in: bacteria)]
MSAGKEKKMREIKFVDTTLRDGNQSLWGATGMTTAKVLSVAAAIDRAGFKAIDFIASIHMGVYVRYHKENPWEMIRLAANAIPNTPLTFGTTGRRFIGFKRLPDSMVKLVLERIAANGIRRVWLVDAAHDVSLILKVAQLCKSLGIAEMVAALSFTISPVHTDEFYARIAGEIAASPYVDTLYIKDQGGLLTPDRIRTLVPALKKAINGKTLEIHSHCSTGLATICYLEAIQHGIDVVHTAVPPVAYGTSLPSVTNMLDNLPYLGYGAKTDKETFEVLPSWVRGKEECFSNMDRTALDEMSSALTPIVTEEGFPAGAPAEHDVYYYQHQIPGGMITTLKRQLSEMKQLKRLPEVIDEVVRVRADLGYPIMVTPLSQFVATQASMNVINKVRYKVVPEGVMQYAAGWFGAPPVPINPDVLDKISSQPSAKTIFTKEFPEPSVKEIRKEMGIGANVDDEEFLLRYCMTDKEVDEMLAAGPAKM